MKLEQILQPFSGTYCTNNPLHPFNLSRCINGIKKANLLAEIDGDIFFPIMQTENYGIARKLRVLEGLKPGCTDPLKGAHNNISARATVRHLISLRKYANKKVDLSLKAVVKASVRKEMREYLSSLNAVQWRRSAKEKLADFKTAMEKIWGLNGVPGGDYYNSKDHRIYAGWKPGHFGKENIWHPGASVGFCPKEVQDKYVKAMVTGEPPVSHYCFEAAGE